MTKISPQDRLHPQNKRPQFSPPGTKPVRIVTKRFVLQVGFSCNARCRFCYYQESLKKGKVRDFTTKEIKTKLKEGRKLGKNMVDISGGEPTIRPDIFRIINFAQKIGYQKICLITNGIKMANKNFCRQLVKAGMNEVLLSIHSPIEKDHDWLTQIPGSHQKIINTLKILNQKKVDVRINSTISNFNYQTVGKLFKLVKPYQPKAVNILILNPSNETLAGPGKQIAIADYREIAAPILKTINRYQKDFKIINVRWLPFCFLRGHENKIRTMWQKVYEDEEWDPYLNIKYNMGPVAVAGSFLAGCLLYPFKTPRCGQRDLYTLFNEILTTFRGVYYYQHLKECRRCSLKKICAGLPRNYVRQFGRQAKLKPYKLGKTIEDPLFFCRGYKDNFESLRLSPAKK